MEIFNKEADEKIIQDNTNQDEQEIPEQLHAPVEDRTGEDHVSHQHEAGWKTDQKGYDKCGNIGFE